MPRGLAGTVFKLVIASMVVGFVLSAIGVTPESILRRFGGTLRSAFDTGAALLAGTLEYIVLGAVLVVPVWLVVVLLRSRRK